MTRQRSHSTPVAPTATRPTQTQAIAEPDTVNDTCSRRQTTRHRCPTTHLRRRTMSFRLAALTVVSAILLSACTHDAVVGTSPTLLGKPALVINPAVACNGATMPV